MGGDWRWGGGGVGGVVSLLPDSRFYYIYFLKSLPLSKLIQLFVLADSCKQDRNLYRANCETIVLI